MILTQPMPTLCCTYVLASGTSVEIHKQHSPKRVWVQVLSDPYRGSLHKVKLSTLHRCTKRDDS